MQIVSLLERDLEKRLEDKQLHVELTEKAKAYVADQGFDPIFGARPLRRFLQRQVETLIARTLVAKEIKPFSTFVVDYNDDTLSIEVKES